MKRSSAATTTEIQREQLFLVQLERELNAVLVKINENLNILKVEELQLRSHAISMLGKQQSSENIEAITKKESAVVFNDDPEKVNKQKLDLEIMLRNITEEED